NGVTMGLAFIFEVWVWMELLVLSYAGTFMFLTFAIPYVCGELRATIKEILNWTGDSVVDLD
ncbi:unnamed protein product, partial [Allacma fusca]